VLRRTCLLGAAAAMAVPAHSQVAAPPEIAALWPQARLQGNGRLRYFGLLVYDARLWLPAGRVGAEDWAERPLALELIYARKLVGRLIAERSIEEMRRGGPITADTAERWLAAMTRAFPDVAAGDRITGLYEPGSAARFFVNGKPSGEVLEAEFARRFIAIWLGEQTSEPRLRAGLLGLAP
jgi:Chalcone isomerase-like